MRARGVSRVTVVAVIAVLLVASSMFSNAYAVSVASEEYVFDFKFGSYGSMYVHPGAITYDHNNDRIIVADSVEHIGRVIILDKDGNFMFKINNLTLPINIAYDHNNDRIIVADESNSLKIFDKDGNLITELDVGFLLTVVEDAPTYRGDVAYDHNHDRIIVSNYQEHKIYVFDKDGQLLFDFDSRGISTSVAYDHNHDRIIVANLDSDKIYVFDKDGQLLFDFGGFGHGNSQFNNPTSVTYDHNNDRIIVADTGNSRLQVFNYMGVFQYSIGLSTGPIDIAYDDNNDRLLFVSLSYSSSNAIYIFDNMVLSRKSITDIANGEFDMPISVTYDNNNNRIIVAEINNHRIQVFDSNGNFLFTFGSYGSDDGEFHSPEGVAYDNNNNRIIVADTYNNRIQVFDSNGNLLFKFGGSGSDDGQFNRPHGVAYDPNNNRIIVADTYNNRIQVFDSNGNFLRKFGSVGAGNGEFNHPIGVTYDPNNNRIIVADTGNHRIQVFDSNGNFLFIINMSEGSPLNVTYDPNNDRIIATDGAIAYLFNNRGDILSTFYSGNIDFYENRGIAYDIRNNRIIATDFYDTNHIVNVFSPRHSLILYEDMAESDGIIDLGKSVTAKTKTKNNNDITNVTFIWIDPSNNEVRNTTVPIVSGEASDTYTPNQVGTWKVVAEFSNGTIVVKELQVPFQVVGIIEETLEFNNTTDFINKLSNILTNEGLSSEQINAIISKIDTSQIPSQGIIKLQLKHGSIYGLGVIMPHDPPLNINENIKVIVLYASLGSPININDLHVKAISPTNNEDILLEENWYPNTIDDPFVWISLAIAVNEAGEWYIVTDFTTNDGNTSTVVLTIQTRFGVVPESIIGILSVIGSSLAVLAVYRRKRKVNNN
jgi:DNA-binding beta-propeller fold protein YncE